MVSIVQFDCFDGKREMVDYLRAVVWWPLQTNQLEFISTTTALTLLNW